MMGINYKGLEFLKYLLKKEVFFFFLVKKILSLKEKNKLAKIS